MHDFVRSEKCAIKQIKLSNCTSVLVISGSNSFQSDKMLQITFD